MSSKALVIALLAFVCAGSAIADAVSSSRRSSACDAKGLVASGSPIRASDLAMEPEHGVVIDVSVRDPRGRPLDVRPETLALVRVGAPFDEAAARRAAERIWQTGRAADLAVETTPAPGGVHVVFRVTPKRTVASVFVAGDVTADDLGALRLTPSAPYDPVAIVAARDAFADALTKDGFADAKLSVTSSLADDVGGVDVCVALARGPRMILGTIGVHGSAHDAELAAVLSRVDHANVPGGVLHREVLRRDTEALRAALERHGLPECTVEPKLTRNGAASFDLLFEVHDGVSYRYASFDVRGALVAPKSAYRKLVALERGGLFRWSEVNGVADALTEFDGAHGRADLRTHIALAWDAKAGTVGVVFEVHAQPGLSIVDVTRGRGRAARRGDTVTARFVSKGKDGKPTSYTHTFELFGGTTVPGVDWAVSGMAVHGKRRVRITPEFRDAAAPSAPPSSALAFDVELLSIE